jgi:hypothetical protein
MVPGDGPADTEGELTTKRCPMLVFVAWLILLAVSWPLALIALVLLPVVWLVSIPLRLLGISLRGVFDFIDSIFKLPGRVLRGRP